MISRRIKRAFSLVELLLVVLVLGIIFGLAYFGLQGAGVRLVASGDIAKAEAAKYAKELGWSVVGISCAGRDTDHDGYVSCTVSLQDGKERNIACGGGAFRILGTISGCKTIAVPMAPQAGSWPSEAP